MSESIGWALTNSDEEEPGGSENGSLEWEYGPVPGWSDVKVGGGDGGAEGEGLVGISSRWTLSSDVWSARCLPPLSAGGCDARRDQNEVARRATSAITEDEVEATRDSRAVFQRCRSATSHRLRFYSEQS